MTARGGAMKLQGRIASGRARGFDLHQPAGGAASDVWNHGFQGGAVMRGISAKCVLTVTARSHWAL